MDKKILIAIVDAIIADKFNDIDKSLLRGPRGFRGQKGIDFSFDEHEEKIYLEIQSYIDANKEDFKLHFSDLTKDDVSLLRLNFSDLNEEEKNEIRGKKGKDGKSFKFEDHEEKIFEKIKSYIESIKNDLIPKFTKEDLKLKFDDLTDDDKKELRGPRGLRGQKGKKGKDFSFEENKNEIQNIINFYVDNIRDSLRLKFKDLTKEEKENLKLKFEDLSDDNKKDLKGSRGLRGQRGKTGLKGESAFDIWKSLGFDGNEEDFIKSLKGDRGVIGPIGQQGLKGDKGDKGDSGNDGVNAPVIVDIEIEETKDNHIVFIFYFNNGSIIETNKIELPEIRQIFSQAFMSGGGQHCPDYVLEIPTVLNGKITEINLWRDSSQTRRFQRDVLSYNGFFVIQEDNYIYGYDGLTVVKHYRTTYEYTNFYPDEAETVRLL